MKNEKITKKAWQTPQIIDLDVDKTELYTKATGSDAAEYAVS